MSITKGFKSGHVYIAPEGRVAELRGELKNILLERDRFFLCSGPVQTAYWAQNIWSEVKLQRIESIKTAATFLREIQRNWWHYPLENVRRTKLIQESLPKVKHPDLVFPARLPQGPMGAFALLSENEMLYAATTSSPQPNGEFPFARPSYETPSEAYLKIWEALVRAGVFPQPGELCVDLGSSPGSWTQALLKQGAHVLSVDKAALEIPGSQKLMFLKKDAFKVVPEEVESPAWIFSDIICYPEKLYELALAWKKAHPLAKFIFTLKFQGKWDRTTVEKFARIPSSQVCHLHHNKHELCWFSNI